MHGVDPREEREVREGGRDLRLRVVPRATPVRLHVRPQLWDRWHGQHAPLRAFGPNAPDPGRGLLHDVAEIRVAAAHDRVVRHACESVPAPIAALVALLPGAARNVRRGWRVALHAPERLVVDPGLRQRVEIARRGGQATELEQVERLELHVDDAVVPPV